VAIITWVEASDSPHHPSPARESFLIGPMRCAKKHRPVWGAAAQESQQASGATRRRPWTRAQLRHRVQLALEHPDVANRSGALRRACRPDFRPDQIPYRQAARPPAWQCAGPLYVFLRASPQPDPAAAAPAFQIASLMAEENAIKAESAGQHPAAANVARPSKPVRCRGVDFRNIRRNRHVFWFHLLCGFS